MASLDKRLESLERQLLDSLESHRPFDPQRIRDALAKREAYEAMSPAEKLDVKRAELLEAQRVTQPTLGSEALHRYRCQCIAIEIMVLEGVSKEITDEAMAAAYLAFTRRPLPETQSTAGTLVSSLAGPDPKVQKPMNELSEDERLAEYERRRERRERRREEMMRPYRGDDGHGKLEPEYV